MLKSKFKSFLAKQRHLSLVRSEKIAVEYINELKPQSLLDVGCGSGETLFRYLQQVPKDLQGIEGSPENQSIAEMKGFKVNAFDLNGKWDYADESFEVIFSNQVIEHLHHTRMFVQEMFRVLKKGGTAVVVSENLASWLNLIALAMGYTPFSLMQTCGRYLGNPLGLHYQSDLPEPLPLDHPAFSGVSGHIRVLTVPQAKELFEWVGFQVEVFSIGLLPLPDKLSQWLEKWIKRRGHFLMIKAQKGKE